MEKVLLIALLAGGAAESGLGAKEFRQLGRQWLFEMVAQPAQSCLTKKDDSFELWAWLNRRGELSVKVRATSGESVRRCVLFVAQSHQGVSDGAETVAIHGVFPTPPDPEGGIVDDVPLRKPSVAGLKCESHATCGAGQACLEESRMEIDGGVNVIKRCVDFQRWLVSNGSTRRGEGRDGQRSTANP